MVKPNRTGYRGISTKWSSGNLEYDDSSGNAIVTVDGTNRKLTVPSGSNVDVSGATGSITFAAGEVDTADLAASAVTTAKIAANAVTAVKVADGSNAGETLVVKAAHAIYDFAVDGGVTGAITLAKTVAIPQYALVVDGLINVITAVTSAGAATVAVGTTAGSAANSILVATAKASLGLNAIVKATADATPFKMSAAGNINITVGTADLTAGKIEIIVYYVVGIG